jgi:hypothetical protein
MVDLPSQPLAELDPAFEEIALETGDGMATIDPWLAGFTASRAGRGKERAYLALTADMAQQTLGTSFRRHVELARDQGAHPDDAWLRLLGGLPRPVLGPPDPGRPGTEVDARHPTTAPPGIVTDYDGALSSL